MQRIASPVNSRQRSGQRARLSRREVAQGQLDDRGVEALLRLRAEVVLRPRLELGGGVRGNVAGGTDGLLVHHREVRHQLGPALVRAEALALLLDQALELVEPELLHEELDARLRAALLLAQAREDTRDRLREREQLFGGAELREHLGLHRHGAQAAADDDLEPALTVDHLRHGAEVVERDQAAGVVVAAAERDLELAPEVLDVRMPQEILRARVGVGRDVEALGAADARELARGHVAHAVAARLTRGDADGRQAAHHIRRVLDVDVVELDVLPRRDVEDAIRVLLRELRVDLELAHREAPHRDLDAHHPRRVPLGVRALRQRLGELEGLLSGAVVAEAVVVALAVGASAQARLREDLIVEFAGFFELDLSFEDVDLAGQGLGHFAVEAFFPGRGGHAYLNDAARARRRDPHY